MDMEATEQGSADSGQSDSTLAEQTSSQQTQEEALELDENRLIRIKGSDKPVKFGDHVKGFQSQFTKASQRAARLEQELNANRERLARYEAQQQQQQSRAQGPQEDPLAQIEQLPYMSGKDAAQVVRNIQQEFRNRDQVLIATLKKMKEMQEMVSTLHDTHSSQSFETKINGWVSAAGLPAELSGWAKKLYLAYEPTQELDEEFPSILQQEYELLNKAFQAQQRQKVAAARQSPFVPGRGGNTGPSRALELKPNASAAEVADTLWESLRKGSEA